MFSPSDHDDESVNALFKTILYLGSVFLLGAGTFAGWIAPGLAQDRVTSLLRRGLIAGAILLVVGSGLDAGSALARVTDAFDASLLVPYLTETRQGLAILIRVSTATVLAVLCLQWLGRRDVNRPILVFIGLTLLATFSVTSHAAGQSKMFPMLADLIHLTAMVAWAGTLLFVGWVPWPTEEPAVAVFDKAVSRLSTIGLISVILLFATGVYASALNLWGPPALTGTAYGRSLLFKVGLVLVTLGVAGVNRWILAPMVALRRPWTAFSWLVRLESFLLVAVLGLTGILTTRPLPEAPATLARPISFTETAGTWTVRGHLSPKGAAGFDLEMTVLHKGEVPLEPIDTHIKLAMTDHEMSPIEVRMSAVGRGVYRASIPLPMAGNWELRLHTPGGAIRVPVRATPGLAAAGMADWAPGLPGLAIAASGLGLGLYGLSRLGDRLRVAAPMLGAGAALVAAGAVLALNTLSAPSTGAGAVEPQNPIAATPQSLAMGEGIYLRYCQACHGVSGRGDGPAAAALKPRPADLRVHMAAGHSDGHIFLKISEGVNGTAMPSFAKTLTEEGRWHVLNFIRTFAAPVR
jgi:putative copper export protein/mono/diheme cytochrome c family protein